MSDSGKVGKYLEEMKARRDAMEPKLISTDRSYMKRKIVDEVLPKGATRDMGVSKKGGVESWAGSGYFGGSGGASVVHTQRPFLPEFDSPDRQWYPQNRLEANHYWRMFYKYDPFFGTAVDMYSGMMTSDFDIVLENSTDPSIKNTLMDMAENTLFIEKFQQMVKEFLVTGECFPHCFFDEQQGVWSYVSFHNPDYIEVMDNPIIDMDPIINFLPDEALREFLQDNSPEAQEVRRQLPAEFVSKVLARQKIRLSSVNCSFIPRKLHPYDERGTSLASRLWRIWMVEDAVYSSTIATFRRNSAPIRVAKLGDRNSGWMPPPEAESKLLHLLTQAEMDPNAWLVWNYGIEFEAWGTQERAITLSKENDTIEKVKLIALGLSKSFLSGEISYSSSKSGLQVFLRRLLSMRQFFEHTWILPKFFAPIIQINDWSKSTPSEVAHGYRIKRSQQEKVEQDLYIKPKIKWKNKLDPTVDDELLNAYLKLKNFGFDVSLDSVGTAVGLDWENEARKRAEEFKKRDELVKKTLGPQLKEKYEQTMQPSKPPGGAGSGAKPSPTQKPKMAPGGQPGQSNPPGSAEDGDTPLDEGLDAPNSGMTDKI
ncbi:hypothetical protein N8Z24_00325 [bacterium]|nr:hypothetical protein [bacterium]